MRRRVAALPIAVSLAVRLQAVGTRAYTHVRRRPSRLPRSIFQARAFPVNAAVRSTALTNHIIAIFIGHGVLSP